MRNYIEKALRTENKDYTKPSVRASDLSTTRLLHATLGLCTESSEIADAFKRHIFYGSGLDKTNIIEEMGDILWYLALISDELKIDFSQIMETNIKKLENRYKEGFSKDSAISRDLDAERQILQESTKFS